MGSLFVTAGNVLSTFLGVVLLVFGGYSAYWGTVSSELAVAFGVLAVGVVAGYRSFTVRSNHWVDAAVTTLLVFGGALAHFAGVYVGVGLVETVGQALFAIGCVYLLVRML